MVFLTEFTLVTLQEMKWEIKMLHPKKSTRRGPNNSQNAKGTTGENSKGTNALIQCNNESGVLATKIENSTSNHNIKARKGPHKRKIIPPDKPTANNIKTLGETGAQKTTRGSRPKGMNARPPIWIPARTLHCATMSPHNSCNQQSPRKSTVLHSGISTCNQNVR
jgi:hypothetical protein